MVRTEHQTDVNLTESSVLYISAHIEPTHANYGMYRPKIDPPPDFDLNRLIATAGRWTRRYFCRRIIDAPSEDCVYPKEPRGLSAVVIAGSLHFWSDARGPLAAWQEKLIYFAKRCILEWNLGFLGLCAGGQIGLRVLGGTVAPNPPGFGSPIDHLEGNVLIRTGELILSEDGCGDPIFFGCPARFGIHEAHGDYFAGVPRDMKVLADSPDLPNQVLGWGSRVRLFQPHPELSLSLMQRVLYELAQRRDSLAEAERLRRLATRLRETRIANQRIVPNFLRML